MRVTVLGDGAWGTALALLLRGNGHTVTLWGPFSENISEIERHRENRKFLPGQAVPDDIRLCHEAGLAVREAEIVVLASPSQYMRGTLNLVRDYFSKERQILVDVAKGIENDTLLRPGEICAEILGGELRYVPLSGPSIAAEVARKCPAAVVVASADPAAAETVRGAFMNDYFRVYTSDDPVGVELGGALKNVYAIAAGMVDGMGLGDNAKAALITRAIAEMARIGLELGGKPETFPGLSGVGDLIVTCFSGKSRNRHVGEALGRGGRLDAVLADMGMSVAEGVKTSKSAFELAEKHRADAPIITEIFNVLHRGKSPAAAVRDLMTRKARNETGPR
jgi:glycerol-3-phosphate dehydrogenase (NAD(P)+)